MSELYIHYSQQGFYTEGPFDEQGQTNSQTYDSYAKVKDQLKEDIDRYLGKTGSLDDEDLKNLDALFAPYFALANSKTQIETRSNSEIEAAFQEQYIKFLEGGLNDLENTGIENLINVSMIDMDKYRAIIEKIRGNKGVKINEILKYESDLLTSELQGTILDQAFERFQKEGCKDLQEQIKKLYDTWVKGGKREYLGRKKLIQDLDKIITHSKSNASMLKALKGRLNLFLTKAETGALSGKKKRKGDITLDYSHAVDFLDENLGSLKIKTTSPFKGGVSNQKGILGEEFLRFLIEQSQVAAEKTAIDGVSGFLNSITGLKVTGAETLPVPLENLSTKVTGITKVKQSEYKELFDEYGIDFNTEWTVQTQCKKESKEYQTVIRTQIKPDLVFKTGREGNRKDFRISVKNYSGGSPSLETVTLAKVLSFRNKESQYIFMNASVPQNGEWGGYESFRKNIIGVLACWALAAALGGMKEGRAAANVFIYINSQKNSIQIIDIKSKIKEVLESVANQNSFNVSDFIEKPKAAAGTKIEASYLEQLYSSPDITITNKQIGTLKDRYARSQKVTQDIWSQYSSKKIAITMPILQATVK